MRRSSTVTVALGLVSLALVACSAIIGTRDLTLVDGDAGGGGGDDQGRADGSVDASHDATTQPPTDGGGGLDSSSNSDSGGGLDSSSNGDSGGLDSSSSGDGGSDAGTCSGTTDFTTDKHNCGRCGHDCLGGDCTASVCQPVTIVKGQPGAVSIAVDATNIYWAGNYNNQVLKADKDGKNVTIMAQGTYATSAYGIALDSTNVYWAVNELGGTIARCAKTGCNGNGAPIMTRALELPRAVAADGTSVYWVENDVVGDVGRVDKADGGKSGYLVTQERNLYNLALDDASVFFSAQATVGRIAKSARLVDSGEADAASAYFTIASGGLYATGITVDDVNVYWAENNEPGAIRFAPKAVADGGVPTAIADSENNPWNIAVDDKNVYWTATGSDTSTDNTVTLYVQGYVATCPKAGCGNKLPTLLATSLANVRGIAIDNDAVYVTYYGNESTQGTVSEGGIVKIAKP